MNRAVRRGPDRGGSRRPDAPEPGRAADRAPVSGPNRESSQPPEEGRPTAGPPTGRRWIVRIAWSIVSQGLSSATNFGLTALLALTATADALGRTLSVLSIYLLALTISRSLVTESLVAAADDHHSEPFRWEAARARLLVLAGAAMVVTTAVGAVVGVDRLTLLLVVGALPVLLVQDGQRYAAWATGRPGAATALDGCWLAVSAALVGLGPALDLDVGPVAMVAAWTAGGVASWLVGRLLIERRLGRPTITGRIATAAARSDRYRGLAHSQALFAASVNLGPVAVAVAFSPTMTAVVKVVLLPFTVILSLAAGVRVVTLPTLRRAIDDGRGAQSVRLLVSSVGVLALVGGLGSAFLVGLVPPGRLSESLALVSPHLWWGVALSVLYVVGQQLADAAALIGRSGVVAIRLATIAAEWVGLFLGAAVAGIGGLVVGWTAGLAVAVAIWAAAWLLRPAYP